MSCEFNYCKMTDLTNMGDLCCLFKVFRDFRLSMKDESRSIIEALDKLIGRVADEEHAGSLGVLIKVLKQHKRLLCSLRKNCREDHSRREDGSFDDSFIDNFDGGFFDRNECCLSLCSCCDDEECCPSCRVTLIDLLVDFKRLNDSRHLLFAFHKDLTCLLEAIFNYYGNKGCCSEPCLPRCDEMFRYVMYLIKLCLGEKCCKRDDEHREEERRARVCKACKPDPHIFPIVIVIFLSLYFGDRLRKYVELYCCCCINRGSASCSKSNHEDISVSFNKKDFTFKLNEDHSLSGIIRNVEIFDAFNECRGRVDVTVAGTHGFTDDKNTFTSSASGVVKDRKDCIIGTIFGSVIGTFCDSDHYASGILCGTVVELKQRDNCFSGRNPYDDIQHGILVIIRLLDKINIEKMIEVLGDGIGGLGKRLLHHRKDQDKFVEHYNPYRDHSKKYRKERRGCDVRDDRYDEFLQKVEHF